MKRTTQPSRWGTAALVAIALVVLGAVAITVAIQPVPKSSGDGSCLTRVIRACR